MASAEHQRPGEDRLARASRLGHQVSRLVMPVRAKPAEPGGDPVQRLIATVGLGSGKQATLDYSMGAGVGYEFNRGQLTSDDFIQRNDLLLTATIELDLPLDIEKALEFGVIANVLSSTRIAYYASSKRTKVSLMIGDPALDGSGDDTPFAEAPVKSGTSSGKSAIKVRYDDELTNGFPRVDPNAEGEGKTLVRVDGRDRHKLWLAVGNPMTGGLTTISSQAFEVTWLATIDNTAGTFDIQGSAGLVNLGGGPVLEGPLANENNELEETTW